jgi:ABC-type Zn uptake system ZnuABC Zn-binding protein ZnuA
MLRKALALEMAFSLLACASPSPIRNRIVVATAYPLAFAAEQLAQPDWRVIDLSPPAEVRPNDASLSTKDLATIKTAEIVLYMGEIGFQPEIEDAIANSDGLVVDVAHPGLPQVDRDPHIWLDPVVFSHMLEDAAEAFASVDPEHRLTYLARADQSEYFALGDRFAAALEDCRFPVLVVPRSVFDVLADQFRFDQVALLQGGASQILNPDQVARVEQLTRDGQARAVFFEPELYPRKNLISLADRLHVPALPLSSLESRPLNGNYLTTMRANLRSLVEGLGCA